MRWNGRSLVFRVDGGPEIGMGHLMRCLSLAQAAKREGAKNIFVLAANIGPLAARLKSEGFEIVPLAVVPGSPEDAVQTRAFVKERNADWIVIDGYPFETDYQRRVKGDDSSLLLIDDMGLAEDSPADLILNQNIYATCTLYPKITSGTQLLLGTRFVLLRQEFLEKRYPKKTFPKKGSRILVTLGGGDVYGPTLKVIEALTRIDPRGLEVVVMTGNFNPREFSQYPSLKNLRLPQIQFEGDVKRMPERMTWADLAVSGGGSTCWELAFMGVPFICGILAENQRRIAEGLARQEAALNVGDWSEVSMPVLTKKMSELMEDDALREKLSKRGKELVDGQGSERVLESLGRSRRVAAEGARQ